MDYELTLYDRIEIIKKINKIHNLECNSYLSFSGGKDSTVLHYLLDLALPGNKIPRVFINTGIEYQAIVDFVKKIAKEDERFVVLAPIKPIKKVLEEYGYPFKSKEHSTKLHEWQQGNRNTKSIKKYLGQGRFSCPEALKYQFSDTFNLKVSQFCCHKLKKEPIKKWAKSNKKTITITAMRKEEGGQRINLNCILTDKNGKVIKFHPLAVVDEEFENNFIERNNIKLAELYYPPFNFIRTGCKGCPFALKLQEQLDLMGEFLPNERKQCELIWKPVYDEYRRIGYRLNQQMSIFDFSENKK